MTGAQLLAIMPRCPRDKADAYAAGLERAMRRYEITTVGRAAGFLGQVAHESAELRYVREVWDPTPNQVAYERNPAAAWPPTPLDDRNRLAWRLGNSEKGDGFTFRGWGWLQNTGRGNTLRASRALFGDDRLVRDPRLLDDPDTGALASAFYWASHDLNVVADAGDGIGLTRSINGGLSGHDARMAFTARAFWVLGREVRLFTS